MFVKFLFEETSRGPHLICVTSRIPVHSLEGGLFILDLTAVFYSMRVGTGWREASHGDTGLLKGPTHFKNEITVSTLYI